MSEPGYNFTNFQEDAAHPFTGRTDAQGNFTGYNPVGLALLTGGTGLITWVLSRMLGMKSGASLTASILGSLAMAHVATGKQRYGDAFDPLKVDQWKEMFNKGKGKFIDPQAEEDAKMRAEQDAMTTDQNKKYKDDQLAEEQRIHNQEIVSNMPTDDRKQIAAYDISPMGDAARAYEKELKEKRERVGEKIRGIRFTPEHQANAAEDDTDDDLGQEMA